MTSFFIIFFALVIQVIFGFGGALVAMPLLAATIGLPTAAPAFALVSIAANVVNIIRWRAHITLSDILPLALAALVGIPFGALALSRLDEQIVTRFLGVFLILYAVYALSGQALPQVKSKVWLFITGFSSGLLAGAYNTGGPPVIAYASTKQWAPDRFRGNLQAYFLISGLVVVVSHLWAGNFTPAVFEVALFGLLGLIAGQFVGVWVSRRIQPEAFRRLVFVLLLGLGVQLMFV